MRYRWEGHGSEQTSVLNHPPVMNEQRVSCCYWKWSIDRAGLRPGHICHCFLAPIYKRAAPTQTFGRGKCKISRQIFGQKPPWNDLRKPHRNAIVLAKQLNRRSWCSALSALRGRWMRCKNFRQPRINSPCGSGGARCALVSLLAVAGEIFQRYLEHGPQFFLEQKANQHSAEEGIPHQEIDAHASLRVALAIKPEHRAAHCFLVGFRKRDAVVAMSDCAGDDDRAGRVDHAPVPGAHAVDSAISVHCKPPRAPIASRWGRAPDRRCWACERWPGRDEKTTAALCADAHGFSLHAGVRCGAHHRKELERLCRYITRPAIANERLLCRTSDVSCGSPAEVWVLAKAAGRAC